MKEIILRPTRAWAWTPSTPSVSLFPLSLLQSMVSLASLSLLLAMWVNLLSPVGGPSFVGGLVVQSLGVVRREATYGRHIQKKTWTQQHNGGRLAMLSEEGGKP